MGAAMRRARQQAVAGVFRHSLKTVVLIAVLAMVGLAQTASQWDSDEINNIAMHLKCTCGCNQNMSCQMQPGCPVCKAAKMRMYNMKASGQSDKQIISTFIDEGKAKGEDLLVTPPGTAGMVGPYVALTLGLGFVLLMIRRFRRQAPAPVPAQVDPAVLEKIEKDLEKLD